MNKMQIESNDKLASKIVGDTIIATSTKCDILQETVSSIDEKVNVHEVCGECYDNLDKISMLARMLAAQNDLNSKIVAMIKDLDSKVSAIESKKKKK